MLPRMHQLQGPYGMYATVYGWSTRVVHIAHPRVAAAVLVQPPPKPSAAQSTTRQPKCLQTASVKSPAYNHFLNFCGQGVFTAHGPDWKAKRAAVLHALFVVPSTKQEEVRRSSSTSWERASSSLVDEPPPHHQQQGDEKDTGTDRALDAPSSSSFSLAPDHHPRMQRRRSSSSAGGYEGRLLRLAHDAAQSLIGTIYTKMDSTCSHPCVRLNVVPLLQRTTVGLIFQYITGTTEPMDDDPNDNDDGGHSAYSEEKEETTTRSNSKEGGWWSSYLDAMTRIRMIVLAQSRSIWFLLPQWCYQGPWSSLYQQEEQVLQPIRAFAQWACRQAQPNSPLQTLQRMPLYAATSPDHETEQAKHNNQKNKTGISQNLLQEAITLLFAGQDTTAATLSWTIHLLSLYPKIQQKLYHQVSSILQEEYDTHHKQQQQEDVVPVNEDVAFMLFLDKKTLSRMTYLDAVIKEAMRLYPVAPFVVRKLSEDMVLPRDDDVSTNEDSKNRDNEPPSAKGINASNDTVTLPKGAFACIWIYALHRNPLFWNRPDDFWPERWLQHDNDNTDDERKDIPRDRGITEGAYMPFARGPRNCLGQPFAQLVLRTLLAHLVYRFSFLDERLLLCTKSPVVVDKPVNVSPDKQPGGGDLDVDPQRIQQGLEHPTDSNSSSDNKTGDPTTEQGNNDDDPEETVAFRLRKEMQAGFTVLPQDGVRVRITSRRRSPVSTGP